MQNFAQRSKKNVQEKYAKTGDNLQYIVVATVLHDDDEGDGGGDDGLKAISIYKSMKSGAEKL